MEISGKVAIVTGASSGIGRVAALRLAGLGARVIVSDIDEEGGAATVQAIVDAAGVAAFVRTDVSSFADITALIARTVELYGGLDILYNNAGIVVASPTLAEAHPVKVEAALKINLMAPILLTQAATAALSASRGVVINTASVSGLRPWPVDPIYSSTKAGVVFFTQAVAPQLHRLGIRINAVCPGMVRTAMVGHTANGLGLSSEKVDSLSRHLLEPDEIVDAVIDLIQDDSITGEARYVGRLGLPPEGGLLKSIV